MMQLVTEPEATPILQKLKITTLVLVWAAGLLLAGSDGPMMPYLNGFGVILFTGASFWLARQTRKPDPLASPRPGSKPTKQVRPRTRVPHAVPVTPRRVTNPAVRPRFARELGVV